MIVEPLLTNTRQCFDPVMRLVIITCGSSKVSVDCFQVMELAIWLRELGFTEFRGGGTLSRVTIFLLVKSGMTFAGFDVFRLLWCGRYFHFELIDVFQAHHVNRYLLLDLVNFWLAVVSDMILLNLLYFVLNHHALTHLLTKRLGLSDILKMVQLVRIGKHALIHYWPFWVWICVFLQIGQFICL